MYYPDEILEEVRSRNDIVDVISSYVKLKRSGNTYFGLCPFHNEKTGSFSVTPGKQMFYCFGCHKGGSVITFLELYENYSFTEAVKVLADRAGIKLPEENVGAEERKRRDERAALLEIQRQAGTYYYYQLRSKAGEIGLNYLRERGLSEETMKNFGLGYAGKFSNGLYRFLKEKGYEDSLLLRSGLFGADEKKGMYDKFWNRVMFPIMDANSRIIGFGGRVMGEGKPKYLNSPETEIFNKRKNLYGLHAARKSRERYLILCEGYMDVIAMHQAGFTNAVASLGTALTAEHASLLRRYTQEVILSYDSDGAGTDAALRAIPMLRDNGLTVRVLRLKPYKDPDEFITREGETAFRERLEQAQNAFLFEIEVLYGQYNQNDPDERTRFQMEAARKIASFELEAQRENYISAVAQTYHIGFDALRQMVGKVLTAGIPRKKETVQPFRQDAQGQSVKRQGIDTSRKLLLTWLTHYERFYTTLKEYISPEDFGTGVFRETAKLLYGQLEEGHLNEAAIVDHFESPEDQALAASLFHEQLALQSPEDLSKAMQETIIKVYEASLSEKEQVNAADISELQKRVARKKTLENLKRKKLKIDL